MAALRRSLRQAPIGARWLTARTPAARILSPPSSAPAAPPPRPAFDTFDVVSRLEKSGFSAEQSTALMAVLNDTILASVAEAREDIAAEAQKGAELINARLESQHRLTHDLVKNEIERFKAELERTRVDFKYEQDKANANNRLDLNLEKGRVKEMVQAQDARMQELKETYQTKTAELRTQIEQSKLDGVKYNIATIVSFFTLGLVVLKFMKP
jgi:phosphopantetheine adenylyltransferase